MSTTAFSELPPHWQRHHFAEVPTTMELLREDALEERADIEEERERRKENSESSKREHALYNKDKKTVKNGENTPDENTSNKKIVLNDKRAEKIQLVTTDYQTHGHGQVNAAKTSSSVSSFDHSTSPPASSFFSPKSPASPSRTPSTPTPKASA